MAEILNNHLGCMKTLPNNGKINYQPQLVQDFSHQQGPGAREDNSVNPLLHRAVQKNLDACEKHLCGPHSALAYADFSVLFFGWANLSFVSDIFLGIFSSKKVHLIRILLLKASLRWMNQSKLPSKYQKGQVVMMLLRITRWVVKFSDSKPREYVVLSRCHALHCVK